jgi:predicted MFS family arabinose efflux permease
LAGTTAVIVLDSVSFLVAAILVALILFPSDVSPHSGQEAAEDAMSSWVARWRDWLQGLRIIRRQRPLAAIFVVGGLATAADAMLGPLLVPFVRDLLKGSALTYGWISVVTGLGALLGATVVGRVGKRLEPMRLVLPHAGNVYSEKLRVAVRIVNAFGKWLRRPPRSRDLLVAARAS